MKEKKSLIYILILTVSLLILAVVFYNLFKDNFALQNPPANNGQISSNESSNSQNENEKIKAPDFSMTDYNGNKVNLSDFKGKPTVINFWATWCGYCVKEMPDFENVYEDYKDKVNFLMVNSTDNQRETIKKAKAFIDENNYSFPVFFDEFFQGYSAYGVYSLPMTFIIDKDGYIHSYAKGAVNEKILRQTLEEIV